MRKRAPTVGSSCNPSRGAKDNVDFYEAFAPYYERVYSCVDAVETVRQWLLLLEQQRFVPLRDQRLKAPLKLVDIGCGPGWHLAAWAEAGFEVTGLDSSRTMLKLAKKNLAATARGKPCCLHRADIRKQEQLANLENSFDLAVSHFNFLNLFAPGELEAVFHGVSSIVRSRGFWVTDFALPRESLPGVRETYASVPDRCVLTKVSRFKSQKEVYEQHWSAEGLDFWESYWFHKTHQYEEAAAGSWSLLCSFEWRPYDGERPLIPVTSDSERIVAAFRRL